MGTVINTTISDEIGKMPKIIESSMPITSTKAITIYLQ